MFSEDEFIIVSSVSWGKLGSDFGIQCDDWMDDVAGKLGLCAAPGANVFCCNDVPIHSSWASVDCSALFNGLLNWFGVCDRDELWAPIAWLAVQKKFVAAEWANQ